jgi:DsbC/DsbD-like thiol-disulfide interchange protein
MCTDSSGSQLWVALRASVSGVTRIFAAVLTLASPARAADALATAWIEGARSEARLVAASDRLAGFEIRLAPGAITYWRNPGDAGLPPTFDFSASDNVAAVEPVFPAPKRIREPDGSEAFGYDGSVVIPLKVTPRDAAKPVTLALHVDFAVCEKVCLPAKAEVSLALPTSADSPYAGAVTAALADAPRPVAPNAFGELASDGGGWRLCAPRQAGPSRDLFVEAPEGWWVSVTPASGADKGDCFTMKIGDKPKDAPPTVPLRLTLTGGAGPIETTIDAATPRG